MPKSDPARGQRRRMVTCPACRDPAPYDEGNPWRPFCSERCRQNDLGAWATERYRVPATAAPEEPAGPEDSSGVAH